MILEEYYKSQRARVYKNYQPKHASFGGRNKLADWYVAKLKEQDCKCYYCETSIHSIKELIELGKLKPRMVRGGGKRGPVLEIDKQGEGYSSDNCVLCCYYCNNDKSYTSNKEDYKRHFGENRRKYFEMLITSNNLK
jgi:Pyruvate/2-oxoacid:ferredoxin oxidoreductase delta subunit